MPKSQSGKQRKKHGRGYEEDTRDPIGRDSVVFHDTLGIVGHFISHAV